MFDLPIPSRRRATLSALVVCCACALPFTGCRLPAPPVPPLEPGDFALGGVPADADSTEIRLTFGAPDSVVESHNPFSDDVPMVTWVYEGFEVRFGAGDAPVGYMITAPGESTARGLKVGDPAAALLRTYGEPTTVSVPGWTYADTVNAALYVIDVLVDADTVRRIYVGRALD